MGITYSTSRMAISFKKVPCHMCTVMTFSMDEKARELWQDKCLLHWVTRQQRGLLCLALKQYQE
jgi:hypothetical protein